MPQLIAKQHLLPSTVWLAEQLRKREEFSPIIFTGKEYSTIPEALMRLSAYAETAPSDSSGIDRLNPSRLLVLDEGGALHDALAPSRVHETVVVEQTTFGFRSKWRFPAILVCRSAAKLFFETQIIARGITRKLDSLNLNKNYRFGVIGLGPLGAAITRALLRKGRTVSAFDIASSPRDLAPYLSDLVELLQKSDVILGCTGTDALAKVNFFGLSGSKIFASCSSKCVEFASLLTHTPIRGYGDIRGGCGALAWTLLNGGYPINFDRVQEWESFDEIILTRRLMLEGAAQGLSFFNSRPMGYMMNPAKQYEIVKSWLDGVPSRFDLVMPTELSEAFLCLHSEGEYALAPKPYNLHNTTPNALKRMRAHKKRYEIKVVGIQLWVDPGVWSPAYDWSSLFYIENFPDVTDRSLLEIGSGTGVISLFAALKGASTILATDANPAAANNTLENFKRYELKNATVILSEGFDAVQGRFDIVVWNAPYHGSRPTDNLERGCADEDYHGIKAFFRDVGRHLNPGGRVIFGFSESGDLELIESLIKRAGFHVVRKLSDWREGYNSLMFDMVVGSSEGPDPQRPDV
jgi:release factor glutamine methyltransferase